MIGTLATGRLTLRAPESADLDRLVALVGDYEVAKMLAVVPHPYRHEDGLAWLARVNAGTPDGETTWAVDDGSGLIGCVSLGKLQQAPSLGYWLGRPYWGKGYMSEAARAALAWFFDQYPAGKVVSQAMDENPASMNVLRKLGFQDDGTGTCSSLARGEARPSTKLRLHRDIFLQAGAA
ncbi:GNAT family N-acetyltransferase [Polymorphum gilvum]|uniref:Acetyltransferase, GNAT family n=1 Tax=Polymorphum gilvum (strain LMG 25793 / CGMCC 1.9160 / SL003B-26A1) TaxID=991905 RepID=F2J6T1_POLGS|nr:GNAT family N-acetyltransferase [Polymorphum gilvum]ADZ72564.1 Acetyltransferase, GNAT family [Polymorphum gilvum SL003B-26A1]